MKRIFIGQFVSEKESYTDKRISQAGNNYQLKFISIVKPFLSISIVPTFFGVNKFDVEPNIIKLVSKSNFKLFKILAVNYSAYKLVKRHKPESVWFYNLTTSNFIVYLLLRYFSKYKLYFIIADYDAGNKWRQIFFKKLISKSMGVIVLNTNISKQLRCQTTVLAGILEDEAIQLNKNPVNKNILFSGSLGKTTGFELALKFAWSNPEFTLYITGRPYQYTSEEFLKLIDKYKKDNIIYKGQLSYQEYLNVLNTCTYALSLRNPSDAQHDYNFPSKILEYLSKGLIVISSKRYVEINNRFLFVTGYNVQDLKATLNSIAEPKAIETLRKDQYSYIKHNFSSHSLISAVRSIE